MTRILSLVLVCGLVPAWAGAVEPAEPVTPEALPAEPAPRVAARAPSADAPLRQDTPTEAETPPSVSSSSDPGRTTRRILVEAVVGSGGFLVGALIGQALSGETWSKCSGCAKSYNTPLLLGAGLGSGLGVYAAGSRLGGNGGFLATMSGSGIGTAAAFLMLRAAEDNPHGSAQVYTALLLPLAGAIAGYEISNVLGELAPLSQRSSGASARLVPVAATTKDGGLLGGLAGQF